jgi:hypothetical protein
MRSLGKQDKNNSSNAQDRSIAQLPSLPAGASLSTMWTPRPPIPPWFLHSPLFHSGEERITSSQHDG